MPSFLLNSFPYQNEWKLAVDERQRMYEYSRETKRYRMAARTNLDILIIFALTLTLTRVSPLSLILLFTLDKPADPWNSRYEKMKISRPPRSPRPR
jgi:hypothetical protein